MSKDTKKKETTEATFEPVSSGILYEFTFHNEAGAAVILSVNAETEENAWEQAAQQRSEYPETIHFTSFLKK